MLTGSNKNTDRKTIGRFGESLVCAYLIKQGFEIRAHGYQIRSGEIDIIAQLKELIVFVEVKTRKSSYFNLSTVITPKKQQSIIATAQHYLTQQQIQDKVIRFDVALLEYTTQEPTITYIPNAFCKDEYV